MEKHQSSGHSPWQCHTGFDKKSLAAIGGRPSLGSVVTKLQGSADAPAPPYVSFTGDRESAGAGYLGPMYKPYLPDGPGRDNLKLTRIDAERLQGRVGLLDRIDRIRRDVDASGSMEAMDVYTQRAVSMLTSARLADALDVEKEDPAIRDRYHLEDDKNSRRGNRSTDNFLAARRLIEAGVRVVYLRWGSWDTHGDNFGKLSTQLPQLDAGLSALLTDLHERGMDKDVTVVMWGEFGRTPKVNSKGGRDHWPKVCSCFLAGGGLRMGQYIGSTDYRGELAQDRPIHFQEVHATLYHALGINPETTQLVDPAGRPQYLLERNTPIAELV